MENTLFYLFNIALFIPLILMIFGIIFLIKNRKNKKQRIIWICVILSGLLINVFVCFPIINRIFFRHCIGCQPATLCSQAIRCDEPFPGESEVKCIYCKDEECSKTGEVMCSIES